MPIIRAVLVLVLCSMGATAQDRAKRPIPSPEEYLGYELGERYTPHAHLAAYVAEIARSSDRVNLIEYGKTYERRPLQLCFISTPRNLAQIDQLREKMAKLADPRRLDEGESARKLAEDLPIFIWLSFNVHGSETSCSEAGLKVLLDLVRGDSPDVDEILKDALIILDPCLNPDGRDRYVNWFNSKLGRRADPNPQSMEHDEPWPGGRFNHYLFDLNRDWAFMTQRETRGRIAEFVKWTPQVHVDFHEMGRESSYFFFPADKPINANFPPYTVKWGEIFGRGNAAAFDTRGWDFFTAESFDLFYPGYGDSWPSLHGAIGMTYEQGGGSSAGSLVRLRSGDHLSLADRVEHHYVAGMATIRTAVARRKELLADFHEFRRSAVEEGRAGAIREFILVPGKDPERSAELVKLLIHQGVEVRQATKSFAARAVTDYFGQALEEKTFPEGCYLVSCAQPTKRLIKTMLEPQTEIRELYFYDVAAWSLPLCYGVEAYWSRQAVEAETVDAVEIAPPSGRVDEGEVGHGWLLGWDSVAGIRATLKLLERKVVLRVATEGFTLDGRPWPRGTIIVPRGPNGAEIAATVAEVATAAHATFVPARSAMTEKGIDLGSGRVQRLKSPRLALIAGSGMSATSFGATRFLIEQIYDIPYSTFDVSRLASLELEDYSAVVFASGRPPLGDAEKKNLDAFVRDGGVVVALDSSAAAFTADRGGPTSISTKMPKGKQPAAEPMPRSIEERLDYRRKQSAPGSIFRVELDPAHPLAYGYGQEIAVFQSGQRTFNPDGGGIAVGRFRDAPPISGYILPESEARMRGRGYLMVQSKGRGAYVLFAADPNFRSGWHGLSRLFLNAVLLLPRI